MSNSISFLMFLILFNAYNVSSDRAVSAMNDICTRFPFAPSCRSGTGNDNGSGTSRTEHRLTEEVETTNNDNTNTQDGGEFCTKYSVRYVNYCLVKPTDNVLKHFCNLYNGKCSQAAPISPVQNISPQVNIGSGGTVNPYWRNMKLTQEDIRQYCSMYSNDYPHCLREKLSQPDAVQFCAAYRELCPNWASDKSQPAMMDRGSPRSDLSRGSAGASQSPFGIPVDGDIGGMMGIPMDGGSGPLTGLGNMGNTMHVPFFGGPVEGGIGYGRSVFAPFFDGNRGFNVIPTKSFTEGQNYRFAGMSAGGGSGVDWSGTPGLGLLNRQLGLSGKSPGIH